jgi:protein NrfD
MRHHYWEWPIACYLFLGGMGGGMFFVIALLSFIVFPAEASVLASVLAWPAFFAIVWLAVGCFFLVFELGQHAAMPYVFLNSIKSVLGHGARLLVVCMVFGILWWLSCLPWWWIAPLANFLAIFRGFNLMLAGLAGFCIMLYTGIFLSTLKAHSFWATPALPVLFTVSALSTACACTMLSVGFQGLWPTGLASDSMVVYAVAAEEVHEILHTLDIILICCEIIVILVMVLSFLCAGNNTAHAAAERWVRGSWAPLFWIGMIGCGLLVPLFLNIIGISVIAAIFALCGGLLLRFLVILTDERAEVPGETRYFTKLKKKGEPGSEFMTKWDYNGENLF